MKKNKIIVLLISISLTFTIHDLKAQLITPKEIKGPYHDSNIIEKCFTFEGRISSWNGYPTLRIWIIGTHRMLGVISETPKNLDKLLEDFSTEVYGTFTVCPLTPYKKGVMQSICVNSVKIRKVVRKIMHGARFNDKYGQIALTETYLDNGSYEIGVLSKKGEQIFQKIEKNAIEKGYISDNGLWIVYKTENDKNNLVKIINVITKEEYIAPPEIGYKPFSHIGDDGTLLDSKTPLYKPKY